MSAGKPSDPHAALPPWPARFNLCDYFLDHNLATRASKVALKVGASSRTYAQVSERAQRVAAALRRAGVRAEDRVLIVLPDGFEFAEAWFGVLRAGGVFAMVNPLLKRDEYEYYLAYSKCRAVIAHTDVLPELADAARSARQRPPVFVVGPDAGGFIPYEQALASEDPSSTLAELEPTGPDDLAGWLFTSGSTGKPKACVHVHGDFAWNTELYGLGVAGYRESDVCLSVPKLFFGYATGTNLMFPFRAGATSVLFAGRATADELYNQIAAHRPTLLTSVPTMINNMLNSPRAASADLSSLRVCLSAGEALPPALYRAWKQRTGVEILDGIGSAEMFHIYISNRLDDVKEGSLGKIVPGYEACIVDDEMRAVPTGEPGRLRVRGGSTAICYWADRKKSRETFQGDWCTSADLFRVDANGYYFYEGRADDLLKVSGIFCSPLEIENALLAHPSIAEVCVVGRDDKDGLTKPCAFVVLKSGHASADGFSGSDKLAAELKLWIKDRMAPHKYPRWFEWRASLPKNDRGKVARKELREDAARGRRSLADVIAPNRLGVAVWGGSLRWQ